MAASSPCHKRGSGGLLLCLCFRKNGRRTCIWPRSATRADSSRVKLSKLPLERPEESSERQNKIRLDRGLDFSSTSRPNCKKKNLARWIDVVVSAHNQIWPCP